MNDITLTAAELSPPSPFNSKEAVAVVFACDQNYLPFFSVALTSLLIHTSTKRHYEVSLLGTHIHQEDLIPIHTLIEKYPNVSFKYIDLAEYIDRRKSGECFHVKEGEHVSEATYYRLYIPSIFQDKKKIIYLDCDLVILNDIAILYDTPLGENLIGATKDYGLFHWKQLKDHLCDVLQMDNPESYFNAGVLIFNLDRFDEIIQERIFSLLAKAPQFLCHDQCLLNSVCEGHVFFLSQSWNVKAHLSLHQNSLENSLGSDVFSIFKNETENVSIFHFSSNIKPWNSQKTQGASLFWKYAKQSPLFSTIALHYISQITECGKNGDLFAFNIANIIFYRRNKLHYNFLKISYLCSWGDRKKCIAIRKKELKNKIREAERFIQNYSQEHSKV